MAKVHKFFTRLEAHMFVKKKNPKTDSGKSKKVQALKNVLKLESFYWSFLCKADSTSRRINIIQRLLNLKVESVGFVRAVCKGARETVESHSQDVKYQQIGLVKHPVCCKKN